MNAINAAPATSRFNSLKQKLAAAELDVVQIKGAAEHNLKHIDVEIPKRKLVVFTGVSGSGKTSLAFDTLFAEGQRRYVESLSAYARQFLEMMEKPKYETIRGLAPTISIEQKAASRNPRSTVGTITEIYDYLRVLFARVGVQFCHQCGKVVGRGDAQTMVEEMLTLGEGTKILLLAPLVENRKGEHKELFAELKAEGFSRVRIDGIVHELGSVTGLTKNQKHNIEVVVDRLELKRGDAEFKKRLTDSVESALRYGNGRLTLHVLGREDRHFSETRSCCGHAFPALEPALFSFNNPRGCCPTCNGLGTQNVVDLKKIIPNPDLSIRQGAVAPWASYFLRGEDSVWSGGFFRALETQLKIDFDAPWKDLPKKQKDLVLHGSNGVELKVKWASKRTSGEWRSVWEGVIPRIQRKVTSSDSDGPSDMYTRYMAVKMCPTCDGKRLRPESTAVRIAGQSVIDISKMNIGDAHQFITTLKLDGNSAIIAEEILKEIGNRLRFLVNVGLDYLTLDRTGPTLSGGEAQRIRLASQVGSELTGVIYILDEPSIGLHPRDSRRLVETLKHLRDIGNTVVVVEHDRETIDAADWIIDFGPGAGHLGGQIVFAGTPADIRKSKVSLTGAYLSGREKIEPPGTRRAIDSAKTIQIRGATAHNLKNVDLAIPLGVFTCVTGVSGAGKSTLINHILYPALSNHFHDSSLEVGAHKKIEGLQHLDKVINIDQQPIGRTPRSNPATYTKLFDMVRDFYAELPESRLRGYKPGRFSFNVKGGRCEKCEGAGSIRVEMHFLADVYVPCEACHGKRFNEQTLQVRYKGFSIADVLDLSVAQAREVFTAHPAIARVLDTLLDVGMGYVKLGQSSTTLSGGEAQRIKLARELARRDTGRTLYILDEPTTGLHFDDVKKLLAVLHRLVDNGNTVLVIEHNLDVIKTADWIIDLGPEGGYRGGFVIAEGTPEDFLTLAKRHDCKSYTARFLADEIA